MVVRHPPERSAESFSRPQADGARLRRRGEAGARRRRCARSSAPLPRAPRRHPPVACRSGRRQTHRLHAQSPRGEELRRNCRDHRLRHRQAEDGRPPRAAAAACGARAISGGIMNCIECGELSETETCAACTNEDAMFAAYRDSIEVPPMWPAVERRIRRRSIVSLAAAASTALLLIAGAAFLGRRPVPATPAADVAADVVAHYRAATANFHSDAAPLRLNVAIAAAERGAARAP